MKNIIKYGLLSLVAAASVSCESFLNEKVVSGVSYDYLETKTGIETAVNGVYSTMRWYVGGERYYCLSEYGVDYVWEGADGGNKDALGRLARRLLENLVLLHGDMVRLLVLQSLKKQVQRRLEVVIVLSGSAILDHIHDHRKVLFRPGRFVHEV